jgi:hypothetical protein
VAPPSFASTHMPGAGLEPTWGCPQGILSSLMWTAHATCSALGAEISGLTGEFSPVAPRGSRHVFRAPGDKRGTNTLPDPVAARA